MADHNPAAVLVRDCEAKACVENAATGRAIGIPERFHVSHAEAVRDAYLAERARAEAAERKVAAVEAVLENKRHVWHCTERQRHAVDPAAVRAALRTGSDT